MQQSKQIRNLLIGAFSVLIVLKIINIVSDTDSLVLSIFEKWSIIWLKVLSIGAVSAGIIFYINHHYQSEEQMSRIGMLVFSWFLPLLTYICWGYNLWLLIAAAVAGFIVGYLTYIIDDHLIDVWDARLVSLPFVIGIGLAATTTISVIRDHWKTEKVHVTHKASCSQVVVERYTKHKHKKSTTYSWDYHTSYNFPQLGTTYYQPTEDKDYTLGYGYGGMKDRVVMKHYMWIGGSIQKKTGFHWILLDKDNLRYEPGISYKVEENFFGTALEHGKEIDPLSMQLPDSTFVPPLPDDIPSGSTAWQSFLSSFTFFNLLFTEDTFVLLRWVYIGIFGLFVLLAVLFKECRISLYTFLISFSVVLLIIFAVFAKRAGVSLSDIIQTRSRRRFGGFGGGKFGGGGAGDRW